MFACCAGLGAAGFFLSASQAEASNRFCLLCRLFLAHGLHGLHGVSRIANLMLTLMLTNFTFLSEPAFLGFSKRNRIYI
jgi:hypothetical protein